jgi:hypothetical protein
VTSAREQIVRILQSLTDISAAELGRRVGVSRERVRQILKDLGYPTARGKGRPHGAVLFSGGDRTESRRLTKATATKEVAEDLLGKGYAIFAPMRTTKTCDLIAVDDEGNVSLILCVLNAAGKRVPRYRGGQHRPAELHHAQVTAGQAITYDPPLHRRSRSS